MRRRDVKVATPLSTLFDRRHDVEKIVSLSDALEVRDTEARSSSQLPRLYHCEFSIVERWKDEKIAHIKTIAQREKPLIISFHALSDFEKPAISSGGKFLPDGRQMSRKEMLENAEANMSLIREELGNLEYLIENNNYFPTGAYEIVTDADFLRNLCDKVGVGLLLDIAHAEITAAHTGVSFDAYLSTLSLPKVRQIHLSAALRGRVYEDAHDVLSEIDWENFRRIAKQCPSLEYVTIEYYRDAEKLVAMLERLRKELKMLV